MSVEGAGQWSNNRMSSIYTNLQELYSDYYNQPYLAPAKAEVAKVTRMGTPYMSQWYGRNIFLPVSLFGDEETRIELVCCTISVTANKNITSTQLSERIGTIKEVFSIGDYTFNIKGLLIARDNRFPDDQISTLIKLYESNKAIDLHNALSDLVLKSSKKVVIKTLNIYKDNRKTKDETHVPFDMTCDSDFVDSLEIV